MSASQSTQRPRERGPAHRWNLQYRLETAAQEVEHQNADPSWAAILREAAQALHNKDVQIGWWRQDHERWIEFSQRASMTPECDLEGVEYWKVQVRLHSLDGSFVENLDREITQRLKQVSLPISTTIP
jgi:hypothetical protein